MAVLLLPVYRFRQLMKLDAIAVSQNCTNMLGHPPARIVSPHGRYWRLSKICACEALRVAVWTGSNPDGSAVLRRTHVLDMHASEIVVALVVGVSEIAAVDDMVTRLRFAVVGEVSKEIAPRSDGRIESDEACVLRL